MALSPGESLLGGFLHELVWWPGRRGGFWVDWSDGVGDLQADVEGNLDSLDLTKSCEEQCDACDIK